MELSELQRSTLTSYIRKASKRAGEHDYMSGVLDAVGDRAQAKHHSSKGDKKRRGIDMASKKLDEETDWDPETRTNREVSHYKIINHRSGSQVGKASTKKGARRSVDRHDNNYGAYAHKAVPVWKEETVAEEKFAPKKLRDIAPKPSRKYNEYKGSTPDERAIIKRYEDNTVLIPDRNGNGDDVFKASNIKRVEKPVAPGDDEEKYAEWNKDVPVIDEAVLTMDEAQTEHYLAAILEAEHPYSKAVPINSRHLDLHWATQHEAPQGSHIKVNHDGVSVHHPDGSVHHIQNGHVHQNDVKYGSSGKHAEAGKYVVSKHTDHGSGFVAQWKKKGGFGHVDTTRDESKAKEFKSLEHARNHINHHSQHDTIVGAHYAIHAKRSGAKVKADNARFSKARSEYQAAVRSSKHLDDQRDPAVQKAKSKMMQHVHPALR